jgi:hypothetical protein
MPTADVCAAHKITDCGSLTAWRLEISPLPYFELGPRVSRSDGFTLLPIEVEHDMPRYYFDTHSDHGSSRDTIGAELANPERAKQELMRALPEIISDELSTQIERHEFSADIRDDSGRVIFSAQLTFVAKWIDGSDKAGTSR